MPEMPAESEIQVREQKDLVKNRLISTLVWGVPIAALIASGVFDINNTVRTAIWTLANLVIGGACLKNALGCGRVHCYFTGPFFTMIAIVSFFHGTGILSLGEKGWPWIGMATLVGGVGLSYLPEWIWGRYFSRSAD